MLDQYEDMNLAHYTNMDSNMLIFNKPSNRELKEGMIHTSDNLRNSFIEVFHWVKGELFDMRALSWAINKRRWVESNRNALLKKKESTQKDLDNLNAGKKTLGTVFKSASDAGGMANTIESIERDIEVSANLLDLLTVYIGEVEVEKFKKEKMALYNKVLS